jgi:eukaryotic-like serine/threonine-protein kinase
MSFLAFIKSKYFFIHTAIILVVIFLVFFGSVKFLESYTNHGQFVVVPDVTGKKLAELPALAARHKVSYQVIDSIYDPEEKPGIVLRQDPLPLSKVKHNRTVYLYVTGMVPPQILMPKLIDRSERQARLVIETYGLKIGRVEEKEADCNGCVLSQSIRGREIEQGETVKKGSVIDLVVGRKGPFFPDDSDSLSTGLNHDN